MAIRGDGYRYSPLAGCVAAATDTYLLSKAEAKNIIDHQVSTNRSQWHEAVSPSMSQRWRSCAMDVPRMGLSGGDRKRDGVTWAHGRGTRGASSGSSPGKATASYTGAVFRSNHEGQREGEDLVLTVIDVFYCQETGR